MKTFNKNESFCPNCLIHDYFFIGGGSWSPDACPKCKSIEGISYRHLTIEEKQIAGEKFDKMWKEKWGV